MGVKAAVEFLGRQPDLTIPVRWKHELTGEVSFVLSGEVCLTKLVAAIIAAADTAERQAPAPEGPDVKIAVSYWGSGPKETP